MESTNPVIIILCLLSAAAGSIIFNFIRKKYAAFKLSRSFKRGARGESRAQKFLEKNGFKILAREAEISPCFWIDGEEKFFKIRADFIVQKKNRIALVEVKTGDNAPDPSAPATRRQIFEYASYFEADDIYLLNGDNLKMNRIYFKRGPVSGKRNMTLWVWLAGILVGFALAGLYFMH